jgi:hypothetical protein
VAVVAGLPPVVDSNDLVRNKEADPV